MIADVRDQSDLTNRSMEAKQALLMALKQTNLAVLDGTRDGEDAASLAGALDQVKRARDLIDVLVKRLNFHRELARIASGAVDDDSSRGMIALVRLGVDGGYEVSEVRRLVDASLGRRT